MQFEITVLGCSSAMPSPSRHHTAHAINVHEQYFLVDCGEGTQYQLLRYGIGLMKINQIFISHIHGDHTLGLVGLLSSMAMNGRTRALELFAPRAVHEMIRCMFEFYGPEKEPPFPIEFREVDTRKYQLVFENRAIEVWSIPLRHRVPASGYLFREKTGTRRFKPVEEGGLGETPRSYAFCSDTTASAKVAGIVQGVDLLYHETTYLYADRALAVKTGHSTARQAGQIAAKAQAGTLLIGHYSSRYKELEPLQEEAGAEFSNVILASDGLRISIARDHRITVEQM